MALNGIKDNKCFEPIQSVFKYKGSQKIDIQKEDYTYATFSDDAITENDNAIVTIVRADGDTIEYITENHIILEGVVLVKVNNSGDSSKTIQINCAVL